MFPDEELNALSKLASKYFNSDVEIKEANYDMGLYSDSVEFSTSLSSMEVYSYLGILSQEMDNKVDIEVYPSENFDGELEFNIRLSPKKVL